MSAPTNYDSTVNSFYLAYYGRPADPAGLAFWSTQLGQANGDFGAINEAFATSAEATARFGSDDAAARITEIYQQLFNREPDAGGLSYWTNAIENGHATVADVALSIMNGAQGVDNQLVELRQQAVDKFTAQVDATGSAYDGMASIEAARVLVRAVTLDATTADIDSLVKAVVSFADTATKNPAVVDAIATGTTLLNLYDTQRGNADPVALTQTLADTAKAAAGNPVTLESLLRGGGMAQVLKVMPADATLHDVVEALAAGGLPAAVEVVYPSTPVVVPVEPVSPLTLAFKAVTEGAGDLHHDNVTNDSTADVSFSFNKNLTGTQHFEVSLDGKNWTSAGVETQSDGRTVTVKDLHLDMGMPVFSHYVENDASSPEMTSNVQMLNFVNQVDLQTTVFVHAVDGSGNVAASAIQTIVYDSYAAAPTVIIGDAVVPPSYAINGGFVTESKDFSIGNAEPGAKIEYLSDLVQSSQPAMEIDGVLINSSTVQPTSSMLINSIGTWTETPPTLVDGLNSFSVRQIDAAGNVSAPTHVAITVGAEQLATPTLNLLDDTGISHNDGTTNNSIVEIHNLSTEIGSTWEYTLDSGESWAQGGVNYGSGADTFELPVQEGQSGAIMVRQHDVAGHASGISDALNFWIDTTKPTGELSFFDIEGGALGGGTTTDQAIVDVNFIFEGSGDGIVQYQLNGTDEGKWSNVDSNVDNNGLLTVKAVNLSEADQTINLRVIDLAGNEGPKLSTTIDSSVNDPITFTATATETGLKLTSSVANLVSIYSIDSSEHMINPQLMTDAVTKNAVVGDITVSAQQSGVSGTLLLHPDGNVVEDSSGQSFGVGSNNDDVLSGNSAWGYDGNDTILSSGGSGIIVGGAGVDTIELAHDAFASTLVFNPGDTATGVYLEGDSILGMDKIYNVEQGDTIKLGPVFNAALEVQTTFLTDATANQVAIVKGSDSGGVFVTDNDNGAYLVQWSDGVNVNSILVHDYMDGANSTPTLAVDYQTGTLTLVPAVPAVTLVGTGGTGIPGGDL